MDPARHPHHARHQPLRGPRHHLPRIDQRGLRTGTALRGPREGRTPPGGLHSQLALHARPRYRGRRADRPAGAGRTGDVPHPRHAHAAAVTPHRGRPTRVRSGRRVPFVRGVLTEPVPRRTSAPRSGFTVDRIHLRPGHRSRQRPGDILTAQSNQMGKGSRSWVSSADARPQSASRPRLPAPAPPSRRPRPEVSRSTRHFGP
ncbi:hypothetical protein SGPA1_21855 [Streptomyces misionensis JCM 4497]